MYFLTNVMHPIRLITLLSILSILILIIARVATGTIGLITSALLVALANICIYYFSPQIVLRMARAEALPEYAVPEVHTILKELAIQSSLPTPKLYLTPDPQPNIFTVGRNPKTASIALTRGLIEVLDTAELKAVLAHEMGHIIHQDILTNSISSALSGLLTAFVPYEISGTPKNEEKNTTGNSLSSLFILIISPLASSILKLLSSPTAEYKADFTGASMTREPLELARALQKIQLAVQENIPLMNPNPALGHLFIANPFHSKSLTALFSTHPPIEERISRLQNMIV